MDVEATTTIRQAEVGAAKTMLDRTAEQFDVTPSRLVADGGYGSAEMVGWLVDERAIEPHGKLIDKAERTDGTFSRSDFNEIGRTPDIRFRAAHRLGAPPSEAAGSLLSRKRAVTRGSLCYLEAGTLRAEPAGIAKSA
jgi:hypothetical protein